MRDVFIWLIADTVAIVCASGSVYMAINDINDWGWFLLTAALTTAVSSKRRQNEPN